MIQLLPAAVFFILLNFVQCSDNGVQCWTCSFSGKGKCGDPFISNNSEVSKTWSSSGWCLKVMHDINYKYLVARGPAPENECTRPGCYRITRSLDPESKRSREQRANVHNADRQSDGAKFGSFHNQTECCDDFTPSPPTDEDWNCCCNEDLCNHAAIHPAKTFLALLITIILIVLRIH